MLIGAEFEKAAAQSGAAWGPSVSGYTVGVGDTTLGTGLALGVQAASSSPNTIQSANANELLIIVSQSFMSISINLKSVIAPWLAKGEFTLNIPYFRLAANLSLLF